MEGRVWLISVIGEQEKEVSQWPENREKEVNGWLGNREKGVSRNWRAGRRKWVGDWKVKGRELKVMSAIEMIQYEDQYSVVGSDNGKFVG